MSALESAMDQGLDALSSLDSILSGDENATDMLTSSL